MDGMIRLFALCLVLLPLAACGKDLNVAEEYARTATVEARGCVGDDATAALNATRPLVTEFTDASERAANTSRIGLSPVVGELQAIRRQLDTVELPRCARQLQYELRLGFDATIDAYLAFMSDDPDSTVAAHLETGTRHISAATDIITTLRANAD